MKEAPLVLLMQHLDQPMLCCMHSCTLSLTSELGRAAACMLTPV
jgi:hypothetical protein